MPALKLDIKDEVTLNKIVAIFYRNIEKCNEPLMKELIKTKELQKYLDDKATSYINQYNGLAESGLYRNEIEEIVNEDLLLRDIEEMEAFKA